MIDDLPTPVEMINLSFSDCQSDGLTNHLIRPKNQLNCTNNVNKNFVKTLGTALRQRIYFGMFW